MHLQIQPIVKGWKVFNLKAFENPESYYGTTTLWSLNDELKEDEMIRQLKEFKDKNLGGVVLHPRGGLATEYLGEDYFKAYETAIDFLRKNDMKAWIYDEDWCPSGVCAGKVIESNPDYAQSNMKAKIIDAENFEYFSNMYVGYRIHSSGYERINLYNPPKTGKLFIVELNKNVAVSAHNWQPYVDVCNKDAIECFVKLTHDKYLKHFKDDFGKTIISFFTDEPQFGGHDAVLPWTAMLQKTFSEKYGYNILDKMPDLFMDFDGCEKTRFDYWDTMSSLFVCAYSKTINSWCEDNGVLYTGHFMEHEFPNPSLAGSVMPHYEFMQAPGMDMLFVADYEDRFHMYGNDFNVREVSSIVHQLGKKKAFSETYGASGWWLDLRYQKMVADWQLSLGITHFGQHLSHYSLNGFRKRDFPQSFLDHQPWWDEYGTIMKYMHRMCYALSQGSCSVDVLVMHPSSSTWCTYSTEDDKDKINSISKSVKSVVKSLDEIRIMCDLGDDIIIDHHGKINQNKFIIGLMEYNVVILPEMITLRKSSFALLKEYVKNGGLLLSVGQTPTLLEGVHSEEMVQFFDSDLIIKIENTKQSLSDFFKDKQVEKLVITELNEKDTSNIYSQIRNIGNEKLIFICNLDLEEDFSFDILFDKNYKILHVDTESCEQRECDLFKDKEKYFTRLTLRANNSTILILKKDEYSNIKLPAALEQEIKEIELSNWSAKLVDKNALNLQMCTMSGDDEEYGDIDDVLFLDDNLKRKFNMEISYINARQEWQYSEEEKMDIHKAKAEYPFMVEDVPKGEIMVALEWPDKFDVYINNNMVFKTEEFYKDRAFVLFNITDFVHIGENTIRLETERYSAFISFESIYIVGDFSLIRKENTYVIKSPKELKLGDIVKQGYPYYSGKIDYVTTFTKEEDCTKYLLNIDKFHGVTAQVFVNNKKVKAIGWKPFSADITEYLVMGENTIKITVANSLQNLLGPFASNLRETQYRVFPESFYAKKHDTFFPIGLEKGIVISAII